MRELTAAVRSREQPSHATQGRFGLLVRNLRQHLLPDARAAEVGDDGLLESGYLDAGAPRYENRRFTLRREHTFRVRRGFPRLVERDLPSGVGDVSYALSLAACSAYAGEAADMLAALVRSTNRRREKEGRP